MDLLGTKKLLRRAVCQRLGHTYVKETWNGCVIVDACQRCGEHRPTQPQSSTDTGNSPETGGKGGA